MTIPKFQQVTDWLYRGGQPTAADFESLKETGVKTVISFRWSSEVMAYERALAKQLGFNYFTIPLSYCIFPTRKQIAKFFSIIDDPSYRPIFLHCRYGSDRTGLMVAYYRMSRQGWSGDRAYAEMMQAGFHKHLVYHFKWALYGFERRLRRQSKLTHDHTQEIPDPR